jgi:hypothetical protein
MATTELGSGLDGGSQMTKWKVARGMPLHRGWVIIGPQTNG